MSRFFKLREEPRTLTRLLMGLSCIGLILFVWWFLTRGAVEERIVEPGKLPSLGEVISSFGSLWYDRALTRNAMYSLWRVIKGFGLALLFGVPLGIIAGCFPRIRSFLAPVTVFGRNVPMAAMVPLTMVWFSLGESQKVGFIFIATFAFVVFDATNAIFDVDQKYVDTAYTLGASRWQIIRKVLIPMAMPHIFTSARLLFGLGFGYIILAEAVQQDVGIGTLIYVSQRRGLSEHIYLALVVITLMAFVIDRLLFGLGKILFPYRHVK